MKYLIHKPFSNIVQHIIDSSTKHDLCFIEKKTVGSDEIRPHKINEEKDTDCYTERFVEYKK